MPTTNFKDSLSEPLDSMKILDFEFKTKNSWVINQNKITDDFRIYSPEQ